MTVKTDLVAFALKTIAFRHQSRPFTVIPTVSAYGDYVLIFHKSLPHRCQNKADVKQILKHVRKEECIEKQKKEQPSSFGH